MSLCSPTHLSLPQWDVGSRKIRFMYLVNLTSFRLTACPHKTQVIPLFLGADVLSSTDVRTENHPRYHAKFAKKGLATKIQFSSEFRFYGLKVPTANNSLWFYSIQGLFRVAFELFSRQQQLAVLETFQDIWKTQIKDSSLNTTYVLSRQLDLAVPDNMCAAESRNEKSQPQRCHVDEESTVMNSSDISDSSADHDYCSFSNQSSSPVLLSVKQKMRRLDDILSSDTQCHSEKLGCALLLLETLNKYLNGNLEEKDVTQTVLALLQARDWGSLYSGSLHSSLGRWLGREFHAANSSISQKVESFKVQHIERISDLPPADELVTELFPEAMQTLLLHWMGLSEESTVEKRRSEYPILLLILEFANHNLITGVAHVLYSSLICK